MPPYDDWNKIDDEEDDGAPKMHLTWRPKKTLFYSVLTVLNLCSNCAKILSMKNVQTCHAYAALDAAMQIQKKKVITGPSDAVGILLFNTKTIPPMTDGKRVAMGDVFTSCNWVLRDGAPKTASKRVFLITDEDDPHSGPGSQAASEFSENNPHSVTVEPFFISIPEKPFDVSKFYSSVLLPNNLVDEDDIDQDDPSVLPESISISPDRRSPLRRCAFHEVPKRAQFSIPFQLAEGFTIGVKGYGLVTEQKKGAYKYFVDLGERMEVVTSRTVYIDEDRQDEVDKTKMVYGMSVGAAADDDDDHSGGTRVVEPGQRPFYAAEDIRSFRTLGLEPGLKLLGFKDRSELKRTFSALLKSMVKKKKMGLVLSPDSEECITHFLCATAAKKQDEAGWTDPAGFHFDPVAICRRHSALHQWRRGCRASDEVKDAARAWIDKLSVKNGAYPPDSYPNPALAYHNAQLQATAFGEEFDVDSFEDLTAPKVDMIHKVSGYPLLCF
ncbi:hypothetical protein MSAN_02347900 [Mycena sanguinolenta]|uniref:ATP-dependent DNA helicase II subunit 1 n=1 Tax=Mycena sanguinolenta TaxID=230812 RepID=A0A8H6X6C9_9AGAR|nr:hypothetical protein MSAN_02347900 [Mycena sanguinolenta]